MIQFKVELFANGNAGGEDTPVIVMRRLGKGRLVVVGDTAFAMNKNLEVESGAPFELMRENPHFWRWLLTMLRDEPEWTPPSPEEQVAREEEEWGSATGEESAEEET